MRVVSIQEMKEIEIRSAQENGFDESLIIENVGINGSKHLKSKYLSNKNYTEVIFLIGKGNNGSDGLAMARHLVSSFKYVTALTIFPTEEMNNEAAKQLKMAKKYGVKVAQLQPVEWMSFLENRKNQPLIVDCILGTGMCFPLSKELQNIFLITNSSKHQVISIDIPSGMDGDSGKVDGIAMYARETLAIGFPKIGHLMPRSIKWVGQISALDAGLSSNFSKEGNRELLDNRHLREFLPPRNSFAHKNTFGHVGIFGGSKEMCGAVALASMATLRTGAGIVTAMSLENCYHELTQKVPTEVITSVINDDFEKFDVMLVGPGLGQSEDAKKWLLKLIIEFNGTLILDADAINLLNIKDHKALLKARDGKTLLTPHVMEFSRFTNIDINQIELHPIEKLSVVVKEINCGVIVKGATSYISLPNWKEYINCFPNSGMATAGSGDVLAGIVSGLCAQEESRIWEMLALGSLIHSKAGLLARDKYGERGMCAGDIIEMLNIAMENRVG